MRHARCPARHMHTDHYWNPGGLLVLDERTAHCPGVGASDPERVLTPDEVRERVEHAMLRAARVLASVRNTPGMVEQITKSHKWPIGLLDLLAEEVAEWRKVAV